MPSSAKSSRTRTSAPRRRRAGLAAYHAKRDLRASGEPGDGVVRASAGVVRRYVIQKHDATRLHYDLRLEMDGVYRSWAVPKGVPTEPGERNLAVEVEDHPLEYGNFEGVIPEGNYGAGTVMLWDRGHYSVSGVPAETAYRQGKIHFAMSGEKCVGEWTLVRLPPRGRDAKTNWLLIRNNTPEHVAPMKGAKRDLSVLSGRTLDEIAGGETKTRRTARKRSPVPAQSAAVGGVPARRERKHASRKRGKAVRQAQASKGAPPTTHPKRTSKASRLAPAEFIAPMKALSVDTVPEGEWRLEIKYDGFRAIALLNAGRVELWSRNRRPLTADYPEVVAALQKVRCANAVIDGEIVALDAQGRSRFQLLQNRGGASRPPIVYYVFDLLHHDGRSLVDIPIEERQMALQVLVGKASAVVQFSPVFETKPETLLAEVRKQGLEGVIAKQAHSKYEPDRRSGRWVKCKVHGEQEFVIGGFTPPRNSRACFGAILVGYHEAGKLMYAGKVGSGFSHEKLAALQREFLKRRTSECPFANLPLARHSRFGTGMTKAAMREVTWVRPELVAQVQFTEWTEDGSLRHPVFLGLRDDKAAAEVVREAP